LIPKENSLSQAGFSNRGKVSHDGLGAGAAVVVAASSATAIPNAPTKNAIIITAKNMLIFCLIIFPLQLFLKNCHTCTAL
jgi:hypothetical protein